MLMKVVVSVVNHYNYSAYDLELSSTAVLTNVDESPRHQGLGGSGIGVHIPAGVTNVDE